MPLQGASGRKPASTALFKDKQRARRVKRTALTSRKGPNKNPALAATALATPHPTTLALVYRNDAKAWAKNRKLAGDNAQGPPEVPYASCPWSPLPLNGGPALAYLEDDTCDPCESTFFCSDFKPTPLVAEQGLCTTHVARVGAAPANFGYFLRSSVADLNASAKAGHPSLRAEPDFARPKRNKRTIPVPSKAQLVVSQEPTAPPQPMQLSHREPRVAFAPLQAQTGLGADEALKAASLSARTRPSQPLAQVGVARAAPEKQSPKKFLEPSFDNVRLGVCSMRSTQADLSPTSGLVKPHRRQFLMIEQRAFPHLFEHPVVRSQKMNKFFDEQDYESDEHTIAQNKTEILKQLSLSVNRFVKQDPTRFV